MNQEYHDITSRLGEPIWYDECGVPRYDPFEPGMCNNIYANEAALLWIACQDCGKRFCVALSTMGWRRKRAGIARSIAERMIHYGDPPHHDCIGDTMNCEDIRVLEYWHRGQDTGHEWVRDTDYEVDVREEA